MKIKEFKIAFKDSLPIMAGYIVLGIGFGMVLNNNGLDFKYALLMSCLIYAGSMQYVTISLLASGADLISCGLMTIVVNIRHLFYGIACLDSYSKIKKYKLYDIFALTDETFSVVVSKKLDDEIDKDSYYFYLSSLDQFYWVLGSFLGSIVGDLLPFSFEGVEFSMTALFICVVINQWEDNKHSATLAGFIISFICLIIFKSSNFVIPSILLIIVFLLVKRKELDKNE